MALDPSPSFIVVIAEGKLRIVVVVLLVFASLVFFAAAGIRAKFKRLYDVECIFMLAALVFYLAYEILLLVDLPYVYRITYVSSGQLDPYPTLIDEIRLYAALILSANFLLWTLLWSVKLSLLFFYRRLMVSLPRELFWWKLVLCYTLVTYAFSIITNFTSCGGPINLSREPEKYCTRKGDDFTRNLNFYGGYASDVSTDLLIMILPLRLVWSLQLSPRRKIAVGAMFSVGFMCIIAATIRMVQINAQTNLTNPNSQWLILFGTVETTTAIIVGSLPSFRFLRKSSRPSDPHVLQSTNSANQRRIENFKLPTFNNFNDGHSVSAYQEVPSSRESLTPHNGVLGMTRHQVCPT
ncbi:hypothetical protein AJ80_06520 [Polytolypa hystricis UAMH7299]|uniref:Rhodopsin domain-containing protein n=1 Tax=Polytolypa hystricis (strain UAMH7299) TaxID=1447883 RepID=A0A2B7XVE5_POLH7|nr:hypothetical protein AJ80_06520 [Polytolypa hystricis UAMH7299]